MSAAEELDELIEDTAMKAKGDQTYLGSEQHRLQLLRLRRCRVSSL